MYINSPHLRFIFPVALSGTVSFALCVLMAVLLMREQATSAEALGENIGSRRAAADLEESIADLIALLRDRNESVTALHNRVRLHISDIARFADQPQEQRQAARIETSFNEYLAIWRSLPTRTEIDHDQGRRAAIAILEERTLKSTQELRAFNTHRLDDSDREHRANVRGMAWGLAGIGGSAALAGLFLGYGVARGLSRSIRRLQVSVRDAAGKLSTSGPMIEVSQGDDLTELDDQMKALVGRIENVVDELRQRDREVLRSEQLAAVGQLAAGVAHEIRNPLASIKMLVQAAREGPPGGLPGEDLEVIEREVRRMERSLQSFLDFARPPRPNKSLIEIRRPIEQTLDLIRGRAAKQKVELRFVPPPPSVSLSADASQLQQVLVNLALNALDAMPFGGTLTITVIAKDDTIDVSVSDTGPGIAPDVRERLFRPFVSSKPTGLGMGLVISRRIAEDHGGSLDVTTVPGGGTTFTLRLPIDSTNLPKPRAMTQSAAS